MTGYKGEELSRVPLPIQGKVITAYQGEILNRYLYRGKTEVSCIQRKDRSVTYTEETDHGLIQRGTVT